jgi:hypothetical protein
MPTVYKNTRGQHAVRQWCADAIARAAFPLTTATSDTSAGQVSLTSGGTGRTRVVLVPGTGFNAAVTLPGWRHCRSAGRRPWSTCQVSPDSAIRTGRAAPG